MIAYFFILWSSTLAALLLLALAGYWTVWPFRGRERPYLWLATPLAGIGTLSLSLTLLYHVCRLALPTAFGIALLFNGAASLAACWRGSLGPRRWRDRLVGAAALVGVSALCMAAIEWSAVREGEPTLLAVSGSDQFGYAQLGDWIVRHPHEPAQASPQHPYESWIELMKADHRFGAYLLAALAGWCRGTTTLFSYDFASGVACAAALLGFAAAFARRPALFVVLLAAAALSVWLRNACTGYFGKTLAYPGCVLLAALYLRAWRVSTPLRLLACLALGTGFGLCHSPMTHATAIGLVFLGVALAHGARLAMDQVGRQPAPPHGPDPGPLWKGALLGLAICAPLVLVFAQRSLDLCHQWPDPVRKNYMIAEALDVGTLGESPVAFGRWRVFLSVAVLACAALGLLKALSLRALPAAGLLLSGVAVLGGWATGKMWHVYQMQGLLYPLALGGLALLLQHPAMRTARWERAAVVVLLLCFMAARVPQFHDSLSEIFLLPDRPRFLAQSEVAAVVERVQGQTVDLCHFELYPCLMMNAELGARGIRVQYREPAWTVLVGHRHWSIPRFARCGAYLLTPWPGIRPAAGSVVCDHWALQPNDGAWLSQVNAPRGRTWENTGDYGFRLDTSPAEITLVNGTAKPLTVEFVALARLPGRVPRTLAWDLAGQHGKLELVGEESTIRIAVKLPPGYRTLRLWAEQAATGANLSGKPGEEPLSIARFSLRKSAKGKPNGDGDREDLSFVSQLP